MFADHFDFKTSKVDSKTTITRIIIIIIIMGRGGSLVYAKEYTYLFVFNMYSSCNKKAEYYQIFYVTFVG